MALFRFVVSSAAAVAASDSDSAAAAVAAAARLYRGRGVASDTLG